MQLKAIVINAGIGDLSIGLEMAGFKIAAAYETDDKAVAIHRVNIDAPVHDLPLNEQSVVDSSEIDLVAAHIYEPGYTVRSDFSRNDFGCDMQNLLQIMEYYRPRAFFLMLNIASAKNRSLHQALLEIGGGSYQILWQVVDMAQMTGFPVKERICCVVGTLKGTEKEFQFPEHRQPSNIFAESFLQLNEPIDPWYRSGKQYMVLPQEGNLPFACWKARAYEETDLVQWNFKNIPLVKDGNSYRRITHREIANLKGFPSGFSIPDTDRQWLYKKLMYAGNVLFIKQIAGIISYTLSSNPWRDQLRERESSFEDLFKRYLKLLADKSSNSSFITEELGLKSKLDIDYVYRQGETSFYFEVKHYNSSYSLVPKVSATCKQLSFLKADGIPILVVANEVPTQCKEQCLKKNGVYVWDVENLLWLFDEFTEIKNEFIASLDYAIEHIVPKLPEPSIFKKSPEQKKKEPDLKEQLLQIPPGKEHSSRYEAVCTDILKYVLGDYLTLWKRQERSNNDLYRFDLCCKIKAGANQDFFDTIKWYFNTKYIVFEFKNYKEKITQKEIYTTEKYLYEKALRKVAIIISRVGADDHAQHAMKGILRENGKLILCLSDNLLLEMMDIKASGEQEPAEFLGTILDDLFLHLEK